jgi:hypothetical protein
MTAFFPFNGNNRHAYRILLGEDDGARSLVPDITPLDEHIADQEKKRK